MDFDPVRAKAEGRDLGLPKHIADLFPESFEDSELGEIPRGWRVSRLGDMTSYFSRGLGPAYIDAGGICVLNQKCIRDRRVDFSKARRHDVAKRSTDGRMLRNLDILVNSTGVGTLGRVAQLWRLPQPAIVDSHITVVRASAEVDPWFLGLALLNREDDIETLGEGSTGQTELSRARLGSLVLVAPPPQIQGYFGRLAGTMLSRISQNDQISSVLTSLRDTLLPKLISGEIRINQAKEYVDLGTSHDGFRRDC